MAPKYEDIILDPTSTLIRAVAKGLPTGLIIGGIAGTIAMYIAKWRSEQQEVNSEDSSSPVRPNTGLVPEGITKILLLLLSFFVTIAGIIIGVIYLKRPDAASRQFAVQVFFVTGVGFVLMFLYTLM